MQSILNSADKGYQMQDNKLHRQRRTVLSATAATALVLLLAGCGSSGAGTATSSVGTVEVATSTDVYGDIVSAIGGDRVHVTPIIHSASQDPHSYQATPQDRLTVSKARLLVENGGGYDDFFGTLAADGTGEHQLINVTTLSGLAPDTGTAAPGTSGAAEFNEHLWYNFETMGTLADTLSEDLARIDPAGTASFTANADRFKSELGKLKERTTALKQRHAGEAVAITEPVPLYLLDAVGLVNKTPDEFSHAIETGDDVPATVMKETLDLIEGRSVKMLAYNAQTEGPQTSALKDAATKAGVPVVDFTETLPDGKNYLQWMSGNVDNVERALQP
jgi:zinc/manganese transport system substrate-binding protein